MIAYDLIGETPLVLLESFSDENVKFMLNSNNSIQVEVSKIDLASI